MTYDKIIQNFTKWTVACHHCSQTIRNSELRHNENVTPFIVNTNIV